jgi:hypothetical protein
VWGMSLPPGDGCRNCSAVWPSSSTLLGAALPPGADEALEGSFVVLLVVAVSDLAVGGAVSAQTRRVWSARVQLLQLRELDLEPYRP